MEQFAQALGLERCVFRSFHAPTVARAHNWGKQRNNVTCLVWQVLPVFALLYGRDVVGMDAVTLGAFCFGLWRCGARSDVAHGVGRQLGVQPSLRGRVDDVLQGPAIPQMFWIAASWIVARVADRKSVV